MNDNIKTVAIICKNETDFKKFSNDNKMRNTKFVHVNKQEKTFGHAFKDFFLLYDWQDLEDLNNILQSVKMRVI